MTNEEFLEKLGRYFSWTDEGDYLEVETWDDNGDCTEYILLDKDSSKTYFEQFENFVIELEDNLKERASYTSSMRKVVSEIK